MLSRPNLKRKIIRAQEFSPPSRVRVLAPSVLMFVDFAYAAAGNQTPTQCVQHIKVQETKESQITPEKPDLAGFSWVLVWGNLFFRGDKLNKCYSFFFECKSVFVYE